LEGAGLVKPLAGNPQRQEPSRRRSVEWRRSKLRAEVAV